VPAGRSRPDLADPRPARQRQFSRLAKLDDGQYDAIMLAAAGLKRLGFAERITEIAGPGDSACRPSARAPSASNAGWTMMTSTMLLAPLHDLKTARRVQAERAMNARLQGGCQVPIGGYAEIEHGILLLRGLVGAPDGSRDRARRNRRPAGQCRGTR
jgi:hydroxymethylbilane synthase